jgi:hypothetical protein
LGIETSRRLLILLLFVAVSVATRAPFLAVPCLDLDEAAHLVVARELLHGGTLYVDAADNRPPLLYAFYALTQSLGGGLPAVRVWVALIVLPLTAFAASAFFRHDRRGILAGLLFLVYGAAYLAHDMHSVSPEVLMLLPLAAALALARDGTPASAMRLFAQGALVGVAVLVRQQAALWLPALALAAWVAEPGGIAAGARARRALLLFALGAGFVVPLAACYAAFAVRGAAADLVFWTWTHNLEYARNPIAPAEALERAAATLVPFLVATAPLSWAGWRSRTLLGRSWWTLAAAAAGSLAGAGLGFRFFPHYLVPLYLPLALAAAPATALWLEERGPAARVALAWPLVLLAGFTAANLFLYGGSSRVYEETRPVFRRVGERLRADACYGEGPLFVWGFAPEIYVESGLRPASRYVMPQAPLTGYVPGNRSIGSGVTSAPSLVRPEHRQRLLSDLRRRQPTFVVDTTPSGLHGWDRYPLADFPELEAFVREGYQPVAVQDGVWIWRRRGCEAAGRR